MRAKAIVESVCRGPAVLLEYSRELGYLQQTLSLSDKSKAAEAALLAPHSLREFLKLQDEDELMADPQAAAWLRDMTKQDVLAKLGGSDGPEWHEKVDALQTDCPALFLRFGQWAVENLHNYLSGTELPTWYTLNKTGDPKLDWLVYPLPDHHPSSAYKIAKGGFEYGWDESAVHSGPGGHQPGYSLAFPVFGFAGMARGVVGGRHAARLNEAVVFQATAIPVDADGGCRQTCSVFWNGDATNIVPVTRNYETGCWAVLDRRNDRELFAADGDGLAELETAAQWVVDNFRQYRNVLVYGK